MSRIDEMTACSNSAAISPAGSTSRVSLEPASAYEAVTRQMVLGVREELREIKTRLNGLLFMVAGAVILEVVVRVMGHG